MEKFVQSSGEHGVVVFTLGSMIKNISADKADMIASGLAQIPQKVGGQNATFLMNTRIHVLMQS